MERQIFRNGTDAHLTTWPTSPKEQKGTPEITFLVSPAKDPAPGDIVDPVNLERAYYELIEIKEIRPAKMTGYNFVRAAAKRKIQK